MIPALAFTLADAERANDEWGANCGPAALAAVLGKPLGDVRPHLVGFALKGYTNPTMMFDALRSLDIQHKRNKPSTSRGCPWPKFGLAHIQWEGPWTKPGVPMRARYRYTHWVGACARNPSDVGIFDINAMNSGGWVSLDDWSATIVPYILKNVPRATGGWHITHSVEIIR